MNPIREIVDYLNARTMEYNNGHPTISDEEWDARYFQLQELEEKTKIIYPDSPTQHINYQIVNTLNKSAHQIPMLSLAKTKSIEEIDKYFENKDYTAMVKMDGLSLSLIYKEGKLVSALTRGNGEVGEDITHNAKIISNIPQTININVDIIVNGEIICPIDTFEKYFSQDYKNPRNFASGSIRLLNSKECDTRKLKFIAWDCTYGTEFKLFFDRLNFLKLLGFEVVPGITKQISTKFIIDWLKVQAENNHYPMDGIVFRFSDIAYGDSLGSTAHHPNHSIAFKFMDETAETKLLDIIYEPSRNGVLTPIAVFEPIDLDGSTINRASVHNITVMKELFHGTPWREQSIEIFKANMIIPQIKSAEDASDTLMYCELPFIDIPTICPDCGEKLTIVKSDTGVETLMCLNEKCGCRLINQLDHFCGKKGLDIKGLSKVTLEKLIDWGWIESKLDIFKLHEHKADWVKKPGFGEKSVSNILNAIEKAKAVSLSQFIASLGIPLVGTTVSKIIEKNCINYSQFRDNVFSDSFSFTDWEGIGPEINKALKTYDYSEADRLNTEAIRIYCIKVDLAKSTSLEGKRFAITGNINMGRSKLSEHIEKNGGTVTSAVSKKTDYLIANQPEESTKYRNAIAYGTTIITENELIKMFDI